MTTFHKFVPTIRIHPIILLFIVISLFTGTFMELFIIMSIVFIHELGHYFMARYYKWRINYIMLWVFGGVLEVDEHGNKPLREDVLVTIAGPLQHIFIYIVWFFISSIQLLPESILDLIFYYNTAILLFNLLPIWPLDGGKLLFIFLSYRQPYKIAYNQTILYSLCFIGTILIVQFLFFPFTLSLFLIMIFLLMENRTEWKQRYYVFMRFLLKRYEGKTPVNDIQSLTLSHQATLMDVFCLFKREKKHPIYVEFPNKERMLIDEMDCLRSYFYKKEVNKSLGEVAKEGIT